MSDIDPKGPRGTEKTRILSGLTHELRTPLGSILMMSELLADNGAGNLDEREIRYAQNIHRAAGDLLELIDQLGELSRIESGRAHLGGRELVPSVFGQRLEELYGPHAADADSRLEVRIAPATPERIATDSEKVERILGLLIESALKVSAGGRVLIEMAPGGGDALDIHLQDSGEPLGDDEREGLFVPFGAAGARSSRRFGGSGLGLPLAQTLARLLEADLSVASTPDGCRFTLRLRDQKPARGA